MRVGRLVVVIAGMLAAAALPAEDMLDLANSGIKVARAASATAIAWVGERIDGPEQTPHLRPQAGVERIAQLSERNPGVTSDAIPVAADPPTAPIGAALPIALTPPPPAAAPPSPDSPVVAPAPVVAQPPVPAPSPAVPPSRRLIEIGAPAALRLGAIPQPIAAVPAVGATAAVADGDETTPREPDAAQGSDGTTGAAAAAPEEDGPPEPSRPGPPPPKKEPIAAKLLFGSVTSAAPLAARAIGFYSKGCLAGGRALEVDGPAWQAMRLSRNRYWGHPKLIELIERFAKEVQKEDGWPGILVGDMSQPRGGPMLTGHASHQIGLDADIWFTPMPSRRLSKREREQLSATSMIEGPTSIDKKAFTPDHVKVVKRAASYPAVERILVHPAIKKALCEAAGKDRAWLGKVRPYYGHHYHFHVRLACPTGSPGCRPQPPPRGDDGCGKELDDWFKILTRPPRKPAVADAKKPVRRKPPTTLADLPKECAVVLSAGGEQIPTDKEALVEAGKARAAQIIDISGERRR